ncbi:hypothetical protein ES708_14103 [subsurface metagenome]
MSEKKVILITGSSKGIGAVLLKSFALKDFDVILNYSKSEKEALTLFNEISNQILREMINLKDLFINQTI